VISLIGFSEVFLRTKLDDIERLLGSISVAQTKRLTAVLKPGKSYESMGALLDAFCMSDKYRPVLHVAGFVVCSTL
jgi:hypothetical protein